MKRIILFSTPTQKNIDQISSLLFPEELGQKIFAYLPSNGHQTNPTYTNNWKDIAAQNKATFLFVDNLLPGSANEKQKIKSANILLITGGNTFELLRNLRQSHLDFAIKKFAKKQSFVLGGFSAGAIILSPTVSVVCNQPDHDVNTVGLTDLTGLNIIDFEVFAHYNEGKDRLTLEKYRHETKNQVREITNDGIITLNL